MTSLAAIRIVVLDVDGVLTDGRLHYDKDGEALKSFNVKDGLGIKALIDAGIAVAVISGRDAPPLSARLRDLGITRWFLGIKDKGGALTELLDDTGLTDDQLLCVGDDRPDLPMLARAAISACPADAHGEVRAAANWVTAAAGGDGCVREISDAILAARAEQAPAFRVVIPSRYGSSRLPGKPLREIAGKPMIAHVWDRAIESGAADVIVATDDPRIIDSVTGFGGRAVMTRADHESGSDRIAEVATSLGWAGDEIVVNLQGDEPAIFPEYIAAVATALSTRPWCSIATLATPIAEAASLFDPNTVKVVLDDHGKSSGGRALLFSRAPIPWDRDAFAAGAPESLPSDRQYLRHLGLYAYRVGDLAKMAAASPSQMERSERLEQLRAFALRLDIHVTIVKKAPPDGVDTENDLERIAQFMTPE